MSVAMDTCAFVCDEDAFVACLGLFRNSCPVEANSS